MELLEFRSRLRSVLLAIIAIIAFLLFLRISFELVEANEQNGFVDAIYQVTDFLITPTEGAVVLDAGDDLEPFNFDALLAIVLYVISGLIIIEIITGLLHDEAEEIVQNVVDAMFKIVEFFLTLRIIFVFFDIGVPRSTAPDLVRFIYDVTSWTNIGELNFVYEKIDWPTIIVLAIVVVFDVLSEQFLTALFHREDNRKRTKVTKTVVKEKQAAPAQPNQQNITINVPVPPAPAPQHTSGSPFSSQPNTPPPQGKPENSKN